MKKRFSEKESKSVTIVILAGYLPPAVDSKAAEIARRFDDRVRSYYARKVAKTNKVVAHATLAHKFARAAYFVMRNNIEYHHDKLFA